jgi:hypothetical protein|tara:strand:- start:359 stop:466 length:108 start_codon:yes stop_codon:yes gene_type:complete
MNKIKWIILDNLPTIWILAVMLFGLVLAMDHAGVI